MLSKKTFYFTIFTFWITKEKKHSIFISHIPYLINKQKNSHFFPTLNIFSATSHFSGKKLFCKFFFLIFIFNVIRFFIDFLCLTLYKKNAFNVT